MKKFVTKLKEFLESKNFKNILIVIGILAIVSFIFQAGMFVGFRKASFFCDWGENYKKNFGQPRSDFRGMMKRDMPNSNGVIGEVVEVSLPSILVAGDDGVEKIVNIGSRSLIRKFRDDVSADTIKIGDSVLVVGSPAKGGMIDARLIRIMPTLTVEGVATSTNVEIK